MALNNIARILQAELDELFSKGIAKGKERIITGIKKPEGEKGLRLFLQGFGDKEFIRMNSNSYLGMSMRDEIIEVEEKTSREFGVGPGAVRFICGTFAPHRNLEKKIAQFHNRDDAAIFSSAYTAVIGLLSTLISKETAVISDELNHNCIINAIRLTKPLSKNIFKHLDMNDLENKIRETIGQAQRLIIVTDGIFSMRGDYAPLDKISQLSKKYDHEFPENILVIVDDSHGVGAFGKTGRGTEEFTNADGVDILIGTLGKAFGINGGYIVSSQPIITYLREKAMTYIYSNPITTAEAACALAVFEILDSPAGKNILNYLRNLTNRFSQGLIKLGFEIINNEHPIVPILVRDTNKTSRIVNHLMDNGILATGLNYPVVPKGDETIRFQINADHTVYDIDYVIEVLKAL